MTLFRKNLYTRVPCMAFLTNVLGFLFQHAVQGWCPPVSLLRRLGFRTSSEIDAERYALKALRGDFKELEPTQDSFSNARLAIRASNR